MQCCVWVMPSQKGIQREKKKSIWNCEKSGEHGEEKIRRRPFHFREDLKMLICNYSIFNCFCTLVFCYVCL